MKILFHVYVLCSVILPVVSQCPDGWLLNNGMCYHFSHDKENWIDAQVICEHYEATLAEVHSKNEDSFLSQEAVRRHGLFWIGANDLMVENEWRWYSSNTPLNYSNWGTNEPNNGDGSENCVEIRGTVPDWNDDVCSHLQWFICQRRADEVSVVIG